MMSRNRWYALTTLRLVLGLGLAVILFRWLHGTEMALLWKLLAEMVLGGVVIGGAFLTGPISYSQYRKEYQEDLEIAKRDGVVK